MTQTQTYHRVNGTGSSRNADRLGATAVTRHHAFGIRKVTFRIMSPEEIGKQYVSYKTRIACESQWYRCSELGSLDGDPWCEYYGDKPGRARNHRSLRCDECMREKGK